MKVLSLIVLVLVCGTTYGSYGYKKPAKHEVCDKCEEEDFSGFGTPASKCGCCPWPCCCKCFEEPGEEPECEEYLDIMWVMDSSGSIGEQNWMLAKQYVMDAISQLVGIGTNQLVAMVTFSTNATLNWCFDGDETSSEDKLSDAVENLDILGMFTNTPEALEVATECMASDADRKDIPNVCIVMTDGRATHNIGQLADRAAEFRKHCKTTVVIGITTNVMMSELRLIAGPDGTVIEVEEFKLLNNTLNEIRKEVCEGVLIPGGEKCFCCCTPAQFFGGGGAYYYEQ